MMKTLNYAFMYIFLFLFVPPGLAAEEASLERGKKYFALCASCHGAGGEGDVTTNAPRLNGQFDWYLERQLINFRKGIRGSDPDDTYGQQMRQMALTLPDEQAIKDVVSYINSLE